MVKRQDLFDTVDKYEARAIELRRLIHSHPELSACEFETSALVKRELSQSGIPYTEYEDYTGVIGLIQGDHPGPVIALRADMDALPIYEVDRDRPYCSRNDGVMHACGHDVHTAVLLSVAKVLNDFKHEMQGTVKLLFQPAEEATDHGAKEFVARGCLEKPHVDEIFGIHVDDQRPCGIVGTRIGSTNSSSDYFKVTIHGKSAHGTRPELGIDAVYVACEVTMALHAMLSRRVGALKNVTLNVGTIHGGKAANIIAEDTVLEMSMRTTDPEMRQYVIDEIEKTIHGICSLNGAKAEIYHRFGCSSVVNTESSVLHVKSVSEKLLGQGHWTFTPQLCMGSEDFSYYQQGIPSCMYDVGIRNEERGITAPLHNCHFDIDERAIRVAMIMQSGVVLERLCGIEG